MSLTSWTGTWNAAMLRRHPGPKSKNSRLPLPSSTMMHVAAWSRFGGKGHVPTNEMRISSGPSSSSIGKKLLALTTLGVGLK